MSGPAPVRRVAPGPMRFQTPNSLTTAFRRPRARFRVPGAGTARPTQALPDRERAAARPGRERVPARTGHPPLTGRDLRGRPGPARTPGREVPGLRVLAPATAPFRPAPPGQTRATGAARPRPQRPARMAGPERTGPRPPPQAVRPPPAPLGPARVVARSHPGARKAAQAAARSRLAPLGSVRPTGAAPHGLPDSARMSGPGPPGHREPAQVAVAGPPRLLETPSAGAERLGQRHRGAAAEGCGDRSGVTHRCQGKPTRCIRPASSRRGTGHRPGPPGSAPRGLAVPPANRRPSRGTPHSPPATHPPTRRRPRPGRSLTTPCCRTGGRRGAPIATGAHTPATPARCFGRRPVAGRRAPAGRPHPVDDQPPPLHGLGRPAAEPERTAGAPVRRNQRGRDAGSEGLRRRGLHPRVLHSWDLRNWGPHSRRPDRWGPDRRSPHS